MFCNIFRAFFWRKRLLVQKKAVPLHAEYVKIVVRILIFTI